MMLHKMANRIAQFFYKNGIVKEEEDIEVYAYGFEIMISSLASIAAVLIIGLIFNQFLSAIAFFLAFIPLRTYAGGYHADTHGTCFFILLVVYAMNMLMLHYIPLSSMAYIMLVSVVFSFIVVYLLSPIDHENKPLDENGKKKCRRISLLIVGIQTLVIMLLLTTGVLSSVMLGFTNGQLAASISLIAVKIKKRKEGKYEKNIVSVS